MYTLLMSWTFRSLVMTVAMVWGLGPQIACFMPNEPPAKAEMDCCEGLSSDCGPSMSQDCCRTVVRSGAGIAAQSIRKVMPRTELAKKTVDFPASPALSGSRQLPVQISHAPPPVPEDSSTILRI